MESKPKFDEAVKALLAATREVDEMVSAKLAVLEAKERRWKELSTMVANNIASAQEKVILNLGGSKFETTKTTLLRFENSYFAALLATNPPNLYGGHFPLTFQRSSEGHFIDRDPSGFDIVLEYLRSGSLKLTLDSNSTSKLLSHLEYFRLPLPTIAPATLAPLSEPSLESFHPIYFAAPGDLWDPTLKTPNVTIEGKKAMRSIAGGFEYDAVALGSRPNPSYIRMKIIDKGAGAGLIGLASKSALTSFERSGFFIQPYCGRLYSLQGDLGREYLKADIENGSIVEIYFDKAERTISFAVNGRNFGTAFEIRADLYTEPLFAAALFLDQGETVEIL